MRALVDPAGDGDVRVLVDDPGGDVLARGVDHAHAARRFEATPDLSDLPVVHEQVRALEHAFGLAGP